MRVAIIMGKMDSGGKKTLVMEYYRNINRTEIQFDFICDDDSKAVPIEEIEQMGGRVYLVPPYQNIFANIYSIYSICKKNRYSIVHAYNSTMNIFSLFAAKCAGVPVRISESISMASKGEWKTYIKEILRPFSRMFANYYLACGRDCGRWQFGEKLWEQKKIRIFKTAIDSTKSAYSEALRDKTRRELGLDNYIVVGHIARFVSQKNPLFLVDICKALIEKNDSIRILLIGDGPLKDKMFDKIRELCIEDYIIYLGRREDIYPFYQAMDVFLLPSLYEGLPVVGLEAQCAGLLTVFSEEVTKEVKFTEESLFLPLDLSPEEWANCILKSFGDRKKRQSNVNAAIEYGFDAKNEAVRLARFYKSIVERVE